MGGGTTCGWAHDKKVVHTKNSWLQINRNERHDATRDRLKMAVTKSGTQARG